MLHTVNNNKKEIFMYAVDDFPARIIGKKTTDIIELREKRVETAIFDHYAFGKAKWVWL